MAVSKKKAAPKKTVKRTLVPRPPAPDVSPILPPITDNPVESRKSYKPILITAFVAVAGIILLYAIFHKSHKTDDTRYDELNKAYNEQLRLRSVERERDSLTTDYYRYYMY